MHDKSLGKALVIGVEKDTLSCGPVRYSLAYLNNTDKKPAQFSSLPYLKSKMKLAQCFFLFFPFNVISYELLALLFIFGSNLECI